MRYNDTLLDSLRTVGDPIPDRIIEELARDGQINQVNQIMRQLFRNSHPVPSELPENIQAWLRSTDQLPAWVDKARLDRAATMFVEYGRCVPLILSTSSLVECYAARKGCKALSFSYRLGHNTKHRLAETAQFLLVVMTPGAFDENGGGIPAIQKVRLMHAAIRFLIRKSGRWNEADMDSDLPGGLAGNADGLFAYCPAGSPQVRRSIQRRGSKRLFLSLAGCRRDDGLSSRCHSYFGGRRA
jgi:hypothetical protein